MYKVQDDEQKFDDVMMDAISDAFGIADADKNGTIDSQVCHLDQLLS